MVVKLAEETGSAVPDSAGASGRSADLLIGVAWKRLARGRLKVIAATAMDDAPLERLVSLIRQGSAPAVASVFALVFWFNVKRHALLPIGDPRFEQGLHFHNI